MKNLGSCHNVNSMSHMHGHKMSKYVIFIVQFIVDGQHFGFVFLSFLSLFRNSRLYV